MQKNVGAIKINVYYSRENLKYDPDFSVIEKIICEPFDMMQGAVMHYPRIENCLEGVSTIISQFIFYSRYILKD